MNYYKLGMDMTRENDVVLHCKNCSEIGLNTFVTGEYYSEISSITFYYDEEEGSVWTDYLETYIEGKGMIYSVSKYGIYENKTEGADISKLDNWQQVPIFVSETFKKAIELNECTGMSFQEIAVE